MNTQELYDYITEHMTAEEALKKLLEGHIRTYEHLKFKEGEEVHPIMIASMAALDMGWQLAIPDGRDDEEVQGMMIGTPEYIEEQLGNGCDCEGNCGYCSDNPPDHYDADEN
jgi:hypothetical protein